MVECHFGYSIARIDLKKAYQGPHVEATVPYNTFDLPLHVLSFGIRVNVVVCYPRRQTSYIP